ncbi:rna-directed dna polymerase from mobile element jockey-like [Pitangus sulphuratus]|nr:rna-directed dna polymerase from mobile element jockey-like [Pitangus sulphuratus]
MASKTLTLDMRRADFRLLRELDEDGHLTNRNRDKTEMFNAFFVSVFNPDDGLRGSQCPELEAHVCENDKLPVDPDVVRDLLLHLDPYKSLGPDVIPLRRLKGLADVIVRPLSMIFEWSWEYGGVPADWKLVNVVLIFKKGKKEDPRNYRPVSITLLPGKVMEKNIMGVIEKHLEDNTVIDQRQHFPYIFHEGKVLLVKSDFLL